MLLRDIQKAPLMVVRPFTLPCGTLMVFIVNPTGGVLGGDHSEIRVTVEGGARVLVVTQSATRVQPSPDGRAATQDVRFEVSASGRLEYHPERTIPYAGSAFAQTLHADLEQGAEFALTETLATGRVHAGERLAFASYDSRVQVDVAGRRVYLDRQRVVPGAHTRAPGVWGDLDYHAAGVFVGAGEPAAFPAVPGRLATGRTAGGAAWLRAAAARGPDLDRAVLAARESLRRQLWGADPLHVRR
ncbi:urease accessory protein [Deinococcus metalli]|uniref:Urease accessory protein UreD n=1 Tax=Deinococcus metalli TaxID=1141878 RepID=A0A7W8KD24_9DEIO|nr:urease accessory protein UreD [Deinococcus metalli]MBB5375705.1 urease accessory protein [Deinococcus metalli]GHF37649.1 urease accessory protein UreD [Deinococcus metalli]